MMTKLKMRSAGCSKVVCLLMGLLLVCSCGEELQTLQSIDEGVPLRLSVALDNSGFTSDSEVIPMGTRAETGSHVVTRIFNSTLFILKKVNDKQWVVAEQRDNVIDLSKAELKYEETLKLSDTGGNYVLLPGTYKFALFVNSMIAKEIPKNELITGYFPLATRNRFPVGDSFLAQYEITLEKTEQLDQKNAIQIDLHLKRNSALVRFVIEGSGLVAVPGSNPIISYTITSENPICTGMTVLGDMVRTPIGTLDMGTEIISDREYNIGEKKWTFSEASINNHSPSLYADNEERFINLTITKIGNGIPFEEYSFDGKYEIENVSIERNKITTILIRKVAENKIEHELNPDVTNWDKILYPPLNYIELNNK